MSGRFSFFFEKILKKFYESNNLLYICTVNDDKRVAR